LRVVEIPNAEARRIAVVQRREAPQAGVVAALVRELKSQRPG
jgi:hypothetical protein